MTASGLGIMGGTGSSLSYDDVISSGNARWAAAGLDCRADKKPHLPLEEAQGVHGLSSCTFMLMTLRPTVSCGLWQWTNWNRVFVLCGNLRHGSRYISAQ